MLALLATSATFEDSTMGVERRMLFVSSLLLSLLSMAYGVHGLIPHGHSPHGHRHYDRGHTTPAQNMEGR